MLTWGTSRKPEPTFGLLSLTATPILASGFAVSRVFLASPLLAGLSALPGRWRSLCHPCRRTPWGPSVRSLQMRAALECSREFCRPVYLASTDIHTVIARACTSLLKLADRGEVCYLLFQGPVSWPVRSGEATVAMVVLRRKHHRFWTKSERWLQTDGAPWQGADCLDSDGRCIGDQMISGCPTETVGSKASRSRKWAYSSAKSRVTTTRRCGHPAIC